jgi:hypothetical protein
MSELRWKAMAVECKHCNAQYTEDGNGGKACAKERMVEEKYHPDEYVSGWSGENQWSILCVRGCWVRASVGLDVTGIRFLARLP